MIYILFILLFSLKCFAQDEAILPQYPNIEEGLLKIDVSLVREGIIYPKTLSTNTKFYESCHKDLERFLAKLKFDENFAECNKHMLGDTAFDNDIIDLANYLKLDILNQRIIRESYPGFFDYFKSCQTKTADFHLQLSKIAKASYDISFQDRTKPKFVDGSLPRGFKAIEFYGHDDDVCFNTGLKAALLKPVAGDYYVFSITGTESSEFYSDGSTRESYEEIKKSFLGFGKEKVELISAKDADQNDWPNKNGFKPTGFKQFNSICAHKLYNRALKLAKSGKNIVFTGHSLGGALAQGLSYKTQLALEMSPRHGRISSVGFMSAAGQKLNDPLFVRIADKIDSTIYVSKGDVVPTISQVSSGQMGEVRLIERTNDVEARIKAGQERLNAHSVDLSRYQSIENSLRIEAQEITTYNQDYFSTFHKKDDLEDE